MLATAVCKSLINLKVTIKYYEKPGKICPYFVLFSTRETEKYLECYVMNGMGMLSILKFKLNSSLSDPVNGNDFLNKSMGKTF